MRNLFILLVFFSVHHLLTAQVVINELVAANVSIVADQDEEYDDWIELYNNGNEAVDLSGYFLSDNPENNGKWEFPSGTSIAANGYLIIWADEDGSQEGLHASFKLSKLGEELRLSNRDTIAIDSVIFGEQETNKAYAREPNGTGNFRTKGSSFNANNDTVSNTKDHLNPGFKVYPNPCNEQVTISHASNTLNTFKVFNVRGQLIGQHTTLDQINIPTNEWESGIYFIQNGQHLVPLIKQSK